MMRSAVGRETSTAARPHRLIDDVPLCAAAAIQRGPSTAAMLNRRTSQKPIARRSWGWLEAGAVIFRPLFNAGGPEPRFRALRSDAAVAPALCPDRRWRSDKRCSAGV